LNGYKVAILSPADALNRFAANALLKTNASGAVSAAIAGHGGLHLGRGVQGHRDAAARGAGDGYRAGLGGAHHGADVVLAEHALHRDGLRLPGGQPLLHLLLDGQQPLADPPVRRGARDVGPDQDERAAGCAVHHAETAPG